MEREEYASRPTVEVRDEMPLLTAIIHPPTHGEEDYVGELKEEKGCIAQESSIEILKEKLLYLYWIKKHTEYKMQTEKAVEVSDEEINLQFPVEIYERHESQFEYHNYNILIEANKNKRIGAKWMRERMKGASK